MENVILLLQIYSRAPETGVIDMAGSEEEIFAQIRELVCMLPADNTENGYMEDCEDDLNRACENVDTMKGDPSFRIPAGDF